MECSEVAWEGEREEGGLPRRVLRRRAACAMDSALGDCMVGEILGGLDGVMWMWMRVLEGG